MELIFASNGFKIYSADNKYSVYKGQEAIDSFASYPEASKTVQDLFISSQVHNGDAMIGKKMFCPDALGSGNIVLVVGKSADGYVVQKGNGGWRMEVAAEHLSEMPVSITASPLHTDAPLLEGTPSSELSGQERTDLGLPTSEEGESASAETSGATCEGCGKPIEGEGKSRTSVTGETSLLCESCDNAMEALSATPGATSESAPQEGASEVAKGEPSL